MTRFDPQRMRGMHAATIVPMTADFRIDEEALAAHIAEVSHVPGIHGLLVNGHAGENFVLTSEEKRRVVEIARASAPKDCVICSGVNAESSLMLAEDAEMAEAAGADILLVFPPNSFALSHDPGTALIHQRHVLAATSLPLILYGAPVGAGAMAYDAATLAQLAAEPRVVGIKDGSWEVAAYEANRRQLLAMRPGFHDHGLRRRAPADELHHRQRRQPGQPRGGRAEALRRFLRCREPGRLDGGPPPA